MKRKLLFLAALVVSALGMRAQTDVTSTYLTNADFSATTPVTGSYLYGYGKDGSPYGFQTVDGWTPVVTNGDNSTSGKPNSGMAGGVFSYGSDTALKGNNKKAPATNPDGAATGNCFGFFGVWSCGGYYYQTVTLVAGKYTITVPMYNQSGTQANTTYTGFFPTSGTNRTIAVNPTVGQWVNQTVTFTLTDDTEGQIRIGYQSTGNGSGANPHIFIDCVKIEFTAIVVKDVLETALTAANNANVALGTLGSAIATAQAVYNDDDATQEQVNNAAATLNAAVELAMSAAGDASFLIPNLGFESCTVTTTNAAAGGSAAPLDISGEWTQSSSAAWSSSAVVEYGGDGKVNGVSAPSTDNAGNTGKTLGVSVGWSGTVTYKSKAATLPAGVYTLKVNAYNAFADAQQFTSKFGFVPTSGTATISSKNSFASKTWVTDEVTFTLNEATEGVIQIGGTAVSGGSGSNAKVFFDNITIGYKSFLAGAKEAYDNAVADANTAKTENPNVTGDELTALNTELNKAEPTTVDGYNTAAADINTAKDALVAAAPSYNAFVTAKDEATPDLAYAAAAKRTALINAKAVATPTSKTDAENKTAAIVTALRAYYESHALAEGVTGVVNYNSAIADANADTNSGWTKGVGTNQGQGYTDSEGNVAPKYLDGGWAQNAACNVDMTRIVEIPAGKYLLTVKARGAVDLTLYTLSIAGETINLPHTNGGSNGVFGNGWEDASIEFESDGTAQTLEIIAQSTANQQWFSINDFRLVQLEFNSNAYANSATDYTDLNNAIAAVGTKTLGFENGQYAPYNNVAALEALAAAKAIDQTAELTNLKTDVEAATAALTSATWTANSGDVDAIFNGMFDSTVEGDWGLTGWTRTNAWGQQRTNVDDGAGAYSTAYYNQPGSLQYGNQGVYTMPLAANTAYKLTFCYRSHENDSNNGMTVSVKSGDNGISNVKFSENDSKTNWKTAEALFTTGAAGNYVLTLANSGNTWITNVSLVKSSSAAIEMTEADGAGNLQVEKYSDIKLTKTVYKGWNTVVLPFSVDAATVTTQFGAGKLYKFTDADAGQLNFEEVTTGMVAHTPYLFNSEADADAKDKELTFAGVITANGNPITQGTDYNFVGTYVPYAKNAAENPITDQDYVLGETAFKKAAGKNALKAFRCYIKANEATSTAKSLNICINGETTSIDTINGEPVNASEGIYDLSGRAVKNPTKGMYIINGKKYLVK